MIDTVCRPAAHEMISSSFKREEPLVGTLHNKQLIGAVKRCGAEEKHEFESVVELLPRFSLFLLMCRKENTHSTY